MSKPKKPFEMNPGDHIVIAWGERCSGPGWSNLPVWVLISNSGDHRVECIQPDQQTNEMVTLHSASAVVNDSMTLAVRALLR